MKSQQIRKLFLEFFKEKGHLIYPSSSLVPDDPSLLLTTAGMVQFKPFFEGIEKPKQKRMTTVQKCARTTDIDRVGHTARHLTFFEMLGNFSFGDYYKKEAISWAWELLTKHYKLDKNKLWATIYTDDEEAYSIWNTDSDIKKSQIARLGKEHNFWSAGDVGPCGPSSEIIYDFGEEHSCGSKCVIGCDCDRWLEIWNLVFMQYERLEDGTLKELPNKNIDTGMGLERIASILQGSEDNFHTDLLKPLLDCVSSISGVNLNQSKKSDVSLKVISDHTRAISFLIADGVIPSNEGRGYVLRRLLRRIVRHGWLLGIENPFIAQPINRVIKMMGNVYPELKTNKNYILRIAETEEEKFGETLKQGLQIINDEVKKIKKGKQKELSGEIAFKLHDTYGFPVELTAEIASENNLYLDKKKYDKLMTEQKKQARASWKEEDKEFKPLYNEIMDEIGSTEFVGYGELKTQAQIKRLIINKKIVKRAKSGDNVEILLDKTPFYAEKGGQVSDKGKLKGKDAEVAITSVNEGVKGLIVHQAKVKQGLIKVDDKITAEVDKGRRLAIARAHSATHLLHWALRKVFGSHVKQAGSLVEEDRLRFDFTHFEPLTEKQIKKVEDLVNTKILMSYSVKAYTTTIDYAKEIQAIAFFSEKYGDFVRVVEAGDFSKELCAGTHVPNTSFINLFKIASESSVGANLRRIEAFTGSKLFQRLRKDEEAITEMSGTLKTARADLLAKTKTLKTDLQNLKKQVKKAEKGNSNELVDKIASLVQSFNGINVIAEKIKDADMVTLRRYSDLLRERLKNSIIMLATEKDGKALIMAAASKEMVKRGFDASKWLKESLPIIKGSGGGKPQLAQAGGKEPKQISLALEKALEYVSRWTKNQLVVNSEE